MPRCRHAWCVVLFMPNYRHVWCAVSCQVADSFGVLFHTKVQTPLVCCFMPTCRHLWCVVRFMPNYRHVWCTVSCQGADSFGVLFHAKVQTHLVCCTFQIIDMFGALFHVNQSQDTCVVSSSRMDHFCQKHSNTVLCVLFLIDCGRMDGGCTCTSVHM